MRMRVAELLEERGMTAYRLARAAEGIVSESTIYRLCKDEWDHLPRPVMAFLCDYFGLEDAAGLFAHTPAEASRPKRRKAVTR